MLVSAEELQAQGKQEPSQQPDVFAARLQERELGVMTVFFRMFKPFVGAQRSAVIGNCFYFPQRVSFE